MNLSITAIFYGLVGASVSVARAGGVIQEQRH